MTSYLSDFDDATLDRVAASFTAPLSATAGSTALWLLLRLLFQRRDARRRRHQLATPALGASASTLRVQVIGTEVEHSRQSYGLYEMRIIDGAASWTIRRRWSALQSIWRA